MHSLVFLAEIQCQIVLDLLLVWDEFRQLRLDHLFDLVEEPIRIDQVDQIRLELLDQHVIALETGGAQRLFQRGRGFRGKLRQDTADISHAVQDTPTGFGLVNITGGLA